MLPGKPYAVKLYSRAGNVMFYFDKELLELFGFNSLACILVVLSHD